MQQSENHKSILRGKRTSRTFTYLDEDPAGPRAQQARGHLPCVLSGSTFCSNRFLQRRTIEVEVVILDRPPELRQSKQKGPEPAAGAVTPDHHRHLRQSSPSTVIPSTREARTQENSKHQRSIAKLKQTLGVNQATCKSIPKDTLEHIKTKDIPRKV